MSKMEQKQKQTHELHQYVGTSDYIISEGTKAEMESEKREHYKNWHNSHNLCGYYVTSTEDREDSEAYESQCEKGNNLF